MKSVIVYFKILNVQSNKNFQYRSYFLQLSKAHIYAWFIIQIDFLLKAAPPQGLLVLYE